MEAKQDTIMIHTAITTPMDNIIIIMEIQLTNMQGTIITMLAISPIMLIMPIIKMLQITPIKTMPIFLHYQINTTSLKQVIQRLA